ncbi:MAG: hypothetical protein ACTHWF_12835 [Brachybacterium sp.]|uniref:hypothetical protein n=1 Tax=unclassified Brachybacterium TaxID=2623841 RepID=UPI003FB67FAF
MHEFRWLAPALIGVTSVPGIRDREPTRDRAFWARVARDFPGETWKFPRTQEFDGELEYSEATGDRLPQPLELVEAQMDPATLAGLVTEEGMAPTALKWTLFDHGVVLFEGVLSAEMLPGERTSEAAKRLEVSVQAIAKRLSRKILEEDLTRLTDVLDTAPDSAEHVVIDRNEEAASELSRGLWEGPLWVARALRFTGLDTAKVEFARAWIAGIGEHASDYIGELLAGERTNVTEWMNYVYAENDSTEVLWEALRRAQYFYAAMRGVDSTLRNILSWSMAERSEVSLTLLRSQLEDSMNQAQELLLVQAEVGKYANRIGRTEMKRILAGWDYDEILGAPVREKLRICRERLDSLAEDRSARSAMFTDVILMTIGVTSVLATAIEMVQFGRAASSDPGQSAFDLGRGRITYWFSSQSIDTIVLVSAIISLVLVLVFVWKRRQSIS